MGSVSGGGRSPGGCWRKLEGLTLAVLCSALLHPATAAAQTAPDDLQSVLAPLREKYGLPALAAAAMIKTRLAALGATGMRKLGGTERVTVEDQWQIGSCTKSMTATVAAMLVERGEMQWTSTVGGIFPELRDTMEPQWTGVTLEQLLTHRSGAPAEPAGNLWIVAQRRTGTPVEQRLEFVRGLLLRRPEAPPGTKFIYSNQGYAIAGAMLERVAGQPWEELVRQLIFEPCLMRNAGFGAPGTPGRIDQPWGHLGEQGALMPIPPGPTADNPPAIAPAAAVHCAIDDLVRYAAWHARGDRSGTGSLKRAGFLHLHTAVAGGDYALGWLVAPRDWARGQALTHAGSNTMFYAVIWIAPARDAAFVAATNCAGESAQKACDETIAALIARYLK